MSASGEIADATERLTNIDSMYSTEDLSAREIAVQVGAALAAAEGAAP